MTPTKVGRYAVVGSLTKGADEEVLVGELAGRRFAIRILASSIDRGALLDDARRIAGLSHPNIAHQEVGLHEEQPFLAAELAGTPLESWLGEDHVLPDQLQVIEGLTAALAHAHAQGLVHGQLAPGRILVGDDGSARVWGFSVRGAGPDRENADYVAPEVLEGGTPTPQADVYSAGVICYEILAGDAPAGEAPRPLRELRKDAPKDLADAIMACRERAADWRPKDLGYLLEIVRKLRGLVPAPRPKPAARPAVAPPRSRSRLRDAGSLPSLPIAFVTALLLGAAAYYFLAPGEPTPTRSAAPRATMVPPAAAARPAPTLASPAPSPTPSSTLRTAEATIPSPVALPTPDATPSALATPPPATPLPASTPAPPTTIALAPTPPPDTLSEAAAGPPLVRAVSPPSLRRGQRTLVDVRGQNLYAGLSAALLRGGRPTDGVRVVQQRFVNATLLQVFIEVDAEAASGAYSVLLSDGQNTTNAVRVDVAK